MRHNRKRETLTGRENAEQFAAWAEANRIASLKRHLDECRAALLSIAALSDGDMVTGRMDEPGSAAIARKVLAAGWIGPCTHGRDPWDRCDECGELPEEVAWARAQITPYVRKEQP